MCLHTGDTGILDIVWPDRRADMIPAHENYSYEAGKNYGTEWNGWTSMGTMLLQVITGLRRWRASRGAPGRSGHPGPLQGAGGSFCTSA